MIRLVDALKKAGAVVREINIDLQCLCLADAAILREAMSHAFAEVVALRLGQINTLIISMAQFSAEERKNVLLWLSAFRFVERIEFLYQCFPAGSEDLTPVTIVEPPHRVRSATVTMSDAFTMEWLAHASRMWDLQSLSVAVSFERSYQRMLAALNELLGSNRTGLKDLTLDLSRGASRASFLILHCITCLNEFPVDVLSNVNLSEFASLQKFTLSVESTVVSVVDSLIGRLEAPNLQRLEVEYTIEHLAHVGPGLIFQDRDIDSEFLNWKAMACRIADGRFPSLEQVVVNMPRHCWHEECITKLERSIRSGLGQSIAVVLNVERRTDICYWPPDEVTRMLGPPIPAARREAKSSSPTTIFPRRPDEDEDDSYEEEEMEAGSPSKPIFPKRLVNLAKLVMVFLHVRMMLRSPANLMYAIVLVWLLVSEFRPSWLRNF